MKKKTLPSRHLPKGHSSGAAPASNLSLRPETTPRNVGPGHALALYVHVPFCETKCPYCDFNTYAGIEALIPGYINAILQEIAFWGSALEHPRASTIFLGGGTPSLLPLPHLDALLQGIHRSLRVTPLAEVTLEANPGDLTLEKLQGYRAMGINRLSIGVQSLDDALLALLGRRHTAQEALAAYHRARQAGHQNISLDLMYGIPHQSLDTWRETLAQALALGSDHLSLYALTLEPGTPMDAQVRQGLLPEPDPDLAADMYLDAQERLEAAGYHHYEISNWARPNRQSRHNLTYWRNLPYLGVGPGAHSSLWPQHLGQTSHPLALSLSKGQRPTALQGYRFSILRSPREYIRRAGQLPQELPSPVGEGQGEGEPWLHSLPTLDMVETISPDMAMGETMMLGLRLAEGVGDREFRERFGVSLAQRYGPVIAELTELGLLQWQDDRLALAPEARLLGNEVFQRFVGE